jgi:hypothetical protein
LLEYMFVEKDQRIQRLILCRWRHFPIAGFGGRQDLGELA